MFEYASKQFFTSVRVSLNQVYLGSSWSRLLFLFNLKRLLCVPGTMSSLSEDAVPSFLQGDLFLVVEENRNRMKQIIVIEWY